MVIALIDAANNRGMNRRKAERTIERGIARGKRTPRTPTRSRLYTRTDAISAVAEWWEAASRVDWTGRSSATDRRVLAAFGLIALRLGKVRFSAPTGRSQRRRESRSRASTRLSTVGSGVSSVE